MRRTCNEASIIIIDECFKGRVTEKMPGKSISNPVYKQAGLFWPCPVLKSPPPFLLPRPDALYCFCFFCFCSISIFFFCFVCLEPREHQFQPRVFIITALYFNKGHKKVSFAHHVLSFCFCRSHVNMYPGFFFFFSNFKYFVLYFLFTNKNLPHLKFFT